MNRSHLPLRLVDFRNGLRAARYAVERDRLDASYGSAGQNGTPVRPGRFLGAEAVPDGARFFFEQYDLNVRFLAPNLVRIVWGDEAPASCAVVIDRVARDE